MFSHFHFGDIFSILSMFLQRWARCLVFAAMCDEIGKVCLRDYLSCFYRPFCGKWFVSVPFPLILLCPSYASVGAMVLLSPMIFSTFKDNNFPKECPMIILFFFFSCESFFCRRWFLKEMYGCAFHIPSRIFICVHEFFYKPTPSHPLIAYGVFHLEVAMSVCWRYKSPFSLFDFVYPCIYFLLSLSAVNMFV